MNKLIPPTPGRIVWYWPTATRVDPNYIAFRVGQPLAAMVAFAHDDRKVNLSVLDVFGEHHAVRDVPLLQEADSVPAGTAYAQWMPYQLGQAAKEASSANPQASPDAATPRRCRIILNGRDVYGVAAGTPLTYEWLVERAVLTGSPSMTYGYEPQHRHGREGGILTPGHSVFAEEGLVVSAAHTGNA